MNLTSLVSFLMTNVLTFANGNDFILTAVSNSPYIRTLYKKIQTEEVPPDSDLSELNIQIRQHICESLQASGFFYSWYLRRIDTNEVLRDGDKYPDIFRLIRNPTTSSTSPEYPYVLNVFTMVPDGNQLFTEFFFVCPFKWTIVARVVAFYISQEYNISPFPDLYMPARFVIGNFYTVPPNSFGAIILAEEPAQAYEVSDFDLESHYIQLRTYVRPAQNDKEDPFCSLVSGQQNQHYRFCAAIYMSSSFKDEVFYPRETINPCLERSISFKNANAEILSNKPYYERMTLCSTTYKPPKEGRSDLFISRSYMSNRLFVYRQDPSDEKIYLENVSHNIPVIDERYSFSIVEE